MSVVVQCLASAAALQSRPVPPSVLWLAVRPAVRLGRRQRQGGDGGDGVTGLVQAPAGRLPQPLPYRHVHQLAGRYYTL